MKPVRTAGACLGASEAALGFGEARFALLYWLRRHGPAVTGLARQAPAPPLPRFAPGSRPILFGAVPGLPAPFAALARQVAGQITDVTDCSWQRDSSAVWRISSASGGCWYLKRHSSARFHAREVAALRGWAQALGPERAPELAAADPELLLMVITAVPGQPVPELQLSARGEREVHRQAGLLLGRLHESTQAPGAGADVSRLTSRVDGNLDQVGGLLTSAQRTLARDCASRLAWLGPHIPAVASHGDFQPRNWLWDPAGSQLCSPPGAVTTHSARPSPIPANMSASPPARSTRSGRSPVSRSAASTAPAAAVTPASSSVNRPTSWVGRLITPWAISALPPPSAKPAVQRYWPLP